MRPLPRSDSTRNLSAIVRPSSGARLASGFITPESIRSARAVARKHAPASQRRRVGATSKSPSWRSETGAQRLSPPLGARRLLAFRRGLRRHGPRYVLAVPGLDLRGEERFNRFQPVRLLRPLVVSNAVNSWESQGESALVTSRSLKPVEPHFENHFRFHEPHPPVALQRRALEADL